MTSIDEWIALAKAEASLTIGKDWAQGRTVFGGLSAAILASAMSKEVTDARPLRILNISFIAPLLVEQEASITVEHLRDGKNVTQMQARLYQNGQVCVQAVACFAQDRSSNIAIDHQLSFDLPPPKKSKFMPLIPGVTPKFLKHVQLNFEQGQLPFTGSKVSNIAGWMKFKKAPKELSVAHWIALADAWPPTVLQMLRWPKPASTLSWQIEILEPHLEIANDAWLGMDAMTKQAGEGYVHTEAHVWSETGHLLMLSRQCDTVFD